MFFEIYRCLDFDLSFISSHLKANCQRVWIPDSVIVVDESMVPTKSRKNPHHVYIARKPHPYGNKIWSLADKLGFLFSWRMYERSRTLQDLQYLHSLLASERKAEKKRLEKTKEKVEDTVRSLIKDLPQTLSSISTSHLATPSSSSSGIPLISSLNCPLSNTSSSPSSNLSSSPSSNPSSDHLSNTLSSPSSDPSSNISNSPSSVTLSNLSNDPSDNSSNVLSSSSSSNPSNSSSSTPSNTSYTPSFHLVVDSYFGGIPLLLMVVKEFNMDITMACTTKRPTAFFGDFLHRDNPDLIEGQWRTASGTIDKGDTTVPFSVFTFQTARKVNIITTAYGTEETTMATEERQTTVGDDTSVHCITQLVPAARHFYMISNNSVDNVDREIQHISFENKKMRWECAVFFWLFKVAAGVNSRILFANSHSPSLNLPQKDWLEELANELAPQPPEL